MEEVLLLNRRTMFGKRNPKKPEKNQKMVASKVSVEKNAHSC